MLVIVYILRLRTTPETDVIWEGFVLDTVEVLQLEI